MGIYNKDIIPYLIIWSIVNKLKGGDFNCRVANMNNGFSEIFENTFLYPHRSLMDK